MRIKFTHWRLPDLHFERASRGMPDKENLIEYSKGNGFYVSDPGGEQYKFDGLKPCARGGKTVCNIIDDSDKLEKVIATGVAYCSMSDNFCYRIGRRIALGRARAAVANFGIYQEFVS